MPFETPLPTGFFDVITVGPTVHESGGAPPTTIMRTDQAWHAHVEWDTSGLLTGWIAGKWDLHLYLESVGPGPEIELTDPNEHEIPLKPGPSPIHYHYHPDVKAGVVPPGAYQLVLTLTYKDAAGNPGQMAGWWQGPIIQFFTPK